MTLRPGMASTSRRAGVALLAGGVAILLNTAALATADLVGLTTAKGGLLKLLVQLSGGTLRPPPGAAFAAGFHVVVGLTMALTYAFALEPRLPGPGWVRGLACAAAVWVVNAAVLLPLLGEGFAGWHDLAPAGMAWFAAAHTLFFVLLAVLVACWLPRGSVAVATE